MPFRRAAPLPLFALFGASALACNAVFDLDAFPRGAGGSEEVPGPAFTYASPACGDCMETRCADLEAACLADDVCFGLNVCLALCPPNDLACRTACTQSPLISADNAPHLALDACRRAECLPACLGDGGLAPGDADMECSACVDELCADANAACLADAACEAILACAVSCNDPECYLRCVYDQPAHAIDGPTEQVVDDLRACWGDCASCNIGQALACGGSFIWGQTNETSLTIGMRVLASKGVTVPAEGVVVTACAEFDLDCEQVQDEAVVDAEGRVSLTVPSLPFGWAGYLRFSGTMPMPIGTEVYPLRYYFGRPITRSERLSDVAVIDEQTLGLVAASLGTAIDPTKAHLVAGAADCAFYQGRGVRFGAESITDGTVAFFGSGSAFINDDGSTVTDATGTAGFLNLEPSASPSAITMFVPGDPDLPVGRYEVVLRPGELTGLHALPTPDP